MGIARLRVFAAVLVVSLLGLAGWSKFAADADVDYSSFPAPYSETHKKLKSAKVDFAKAVDIAKTEAGGMVSSVQARLEGDKVLYDIALVLDGSKKHLVVDGVSGEVTSQTDVPRFPGAAVTGEATTTPSGLKYYELVVGEGDSPAATSTVKVHYTGWLVDGTKFDSSVDRGEPISFPLDRVIRGWTEGVSSMKVGGKRKLLIPYDLGYGERGFPPRIPQKAGLIFDVELIEIVEQ